MIKTKDLEKFAESLGEELIDISCGKSWLTARYYKSQFDDFRLSHVDRISTSSSYYGIAIEKNYVKLQNNIFEELENEESTFKPHFNNWGEDCRITGTNLAKLIRDFCYKEQQWIKNNENPDAKPN